MEKHVMQSKENFIALERKDDLKLYQRALKICSAQRRTTSIIYLNFFYLIKKGISGILSNAFKVSSS